MGVHDRGYTSQIRATRNEYIWLSIVENHMESDNVVTMRVRGASTLYDRFYLTQFQS